MNTDERRMHSQLTAAVDAMQADDLETAEELIQQVENELVNGDGHYGLIFYIQTEQLVTTLTTLLTTSKTGRDFTRSA